MPGVYPPVTIDGRRYVDGGMRSAANADLADGYDRLVVLAPIPRGFGPMASVDAQVTGMVSRVAVVSPDKGSRTAIGRNVLDPAARAPSAQAGQRAGGFGRRAGRRGLDRLSSPPANDHEVREATRRSPSVCRLANFMIAGEGRQRRSHSQMPTPANQTPIR